MQTGKQPSPGPTPADQLDELSELALEVVVSGKFGPGWSPGWGPTGRPTWGPDWGWGPAYGPWGFSRWWW